MPDQTPKPDEQTPQPPQPPQPQRVDIHVRGDNGTPPPVRQQERSQAIPRERFDEVNARLKAAQAELAKLQEIQAKLDTAEGEAASWRRRYEQDTPMLVSGYPHLQHPEVRDIVRDQYDRYAQRTGDKAKPFGEWFTEQSEKPSPVLAPFLVRPEPERKGEEEEIPEPPAAQPPPGQPPASQPPSAPPGRTPPSGPKRYTPEQIARLRAQGKLRRGSPHWKAVMEQYEADGVVSPGWRSLLPSG